MLKACLEIAEPLLARFLQEGHKIRGIGLHTVEMDANNQLELFFREDDKLARLHFAMDKINNRFSLDTIMQASTKYAIEGKTHFLERNDHCANRRYARAVFWCVQLMLSAVSITLFLRLAATCTLVVRNGSSL